MSEAVHNQPSVENDNRILVVDDEQAVRKVVAGLLDFHAPHRDNWNGI